MARGGAVIGLILIIIGIILFPVLLSSFDDMSKTDAATIGTVATGVGVTTGDVTLNSGLYDTNLDNIIDISSTDTDDFPAPSSYNENTDALTVSGLEASTSRALTVEYYTEMDTGYISTILPIAPFVVFLIFLGAGGGIMYRSIRR